MLLGIDRLLENDSQHLSEPVSQDIDIHGGAYEVRVDIEHDAGGHRERSRLSTREEDPDGLRRKSLLPQHGIAAYGRYMVLSVVCRCSSPRRRRHEPFCDHVPDLPLGLAGELGKLANIHDQRLSTRTLSKEYGGLLAHATTK